MASTIFAPTIPAAPEIIPDAAALARLELATAEAAIPTPPATAAPAEEAAAATLAIAAAMAVNIHDPRICLLFPDNKLLDSLFSFFDLIFLMLYNSENKFQEIIGKKFFHKYLRKY